MNISERNTVSKRIGNRKRNEHPLTYSSWNSMKQRCDNPKAHGYENYGGRGIVYQNSWSLFDNFLDDMGERPKGTSIDRIDSNGNYTTENCRWASKAEQQRNQRVHKNPDVGISYDPKHPSNKWAASIHVNNKKIGTRFKTKDQALAWRKEKESELWHSQI